MPSKDLSNNQIAMRELLSKNLNQRRLPVKYQGLIRPALPLAESPYFNPYQYVSKNSGRLVPKQGYEIVYSNGNISTIRSNPVQYTEYILDKNGKKDKRTATYVPHELEFDNTGNLIRETKRDIYRYYNKSTDKYTKQMFKEYNKEILSYKNGTLIDKQVNSPYTQKTIDKDKTTRSISSLYNTANDIPLSKWVNYNQKPQVHNYYTVSYAGKNYNTPDINWKPKQYYQDLEEYNNKLKEYTKIINSKLPTGVYVSGYVQNGHSNLFPSNDSATVFKDKRDPISQKAIEYGASPWAVDFTRGFIDIPVSIAKGAYKTSIPYLIKSLISGETVPTIINDKDVQALGITAVSALLPAKLALAGAAGLTGYEGYKAFESRNPEDYGRTVFLATPLIAKTYSKMKGLYGTPKEFIEMTQKVPPVLKEQYLAGVEAWKKLRSLDKTTLRDLQRAFAVKPSKLISEQESVTLTENAPKADYVKGSQSVFNWLSQEQINILNKKGLNPQDLDIAINNRLLDIVNTRKSVANTIAEELTKETGEKYETYSDQFGTTNIRKIGETKPLLQIVKPDSLSYQRPPITIPSILSQKVRIDEPVTALGRQIQAYWEKSNPKDYYRSLAEFKTLQEAYGEKYANTVLFPDWYARNKAIIDYGIAYQELATKPPVSIPPWYSALKPISLTNLKSKILDQVSKLKLNKAGQKSIQISTPEMFDEYSYLFGEKEKYPITYALKYGITPTYQSYVYTDDTLYYPYESKYYPMPYPPYQPSYKRGYYTTSNPYYYYTQGYPQPEPSYIPSLESKPKESKKPKERNTGNVTKRNTRAFYPYSDTFEGQYFQTYDQAVHAGMHIVDALPETSFNIGTESVPLTAIRTAKAYKTPYKFININGRFHEKKKYQNDSPGEFNWMKLMDFMRER